MSFHFLAPVFAHLTLLIPHWLAVRSPCPLPDAYAGAPLPQPGSINAGGSTMPVAPSQIFAPSSAPSFSPAPSCHPRSLIGQSARSRRNPFHQYFPSLAPFPCREIVEMQRTACHCAAQCSKLVLFRALHTSSRSICKWAVNLSSPCARLPHCTKGP